MSSADSMLYYCYIVATVQSNKLLMPGNGADTATLPRVTLCCEHVVRGEMAIHCLHV